MSFSRKSHRLQVHVAALAASRRAAAFTEGNRDLVTSIAAVSLLGCYRPPAAQTTLYAPLAIKSGSGNKMSEMRGERDDRIGGEEDSPQKLDASVAIDIASKTCQRCQ